VRDRAGLGPPDGKARALQNALKHGLRANRFVVVGDEKAAEFVALEAAPDGALQGLAHRPRRRSGSSAPRKSNQTRSPQESW
jgi:hypothetical protein